MKLSEFLPEYQRGGDYDPSFAKFGNPEPSQKDNKNGWTKTHGGDSVTIRGRGRKTRKVIARKVGDAIETIDDEGNRKLYDIKGHAKSGNIDYKRMGTGTHYRTGGMPVSESRIQENSDGTGASLGGSGAVGRPVPGPAELEYDLTKVDDEFKGKDTRSDIKKSKAKRITLKKYLQQRTDREVNRLTA